MLQAGHPLTPESAAEAAAPGVWLLQNGAPLPTPQLATSQQEPEGPNPFQSSPGGDMPGAGDGRGPSLQYTAPLPPVSHPRQAGTQPFPGEKVSGYGNPSSETGRQLSEAGSSDTEEELVGASDRDSSDAHQWASQPASRAALHVHNSEPELHSRGHLSVSSLGTQVCAHCLWEAVSSGLGSRHRSHAAECPLAPLCPTGLHVATNQACKEQ